MLTFVPLHLSALERSCMLKEWIDSTFNSPEIEPAQLLAPLDWFEKGHDIVGGEYNLDGVWLPTYQKGRYVWCPPPAGGIIAVEQIRRARLKRQESTHIVIIPRLFTSKWRKQLRRVADLTLELPFLNNTWTQSEQHEPLTLAFIFPFLHSKPWQLKRSPAFLGVGRLLRSLWSESPQSLGTLLRQLCVCSETLGSMQEDVVRKVLQDGTGRRLLYPQGRQ